MKRGEVRWYRFAAPDKRRPVLVLTRSSIISHLSEVTVAPITSTIRDIPSEVLIGKSTGMNSDCAVNLDHLQTVSKVKIGASITRLPRAKMEEVQRALQFALGFDEDI